jgi:Sporulation and spore germination
MTRRAILLSILLAAVLAAGLLYFARIRKSFFHKATPRAEQAARTRLTEQALQPPSGPTQLITLYFPSYTDGQLLPETRPLALAPDNTDRIRQILLALVEGSHEGHPSSLPPSTTIRAVFLSSDGTAFLDLSQDAVEGFAPGIESETLAVYSIVDSLAADVPAVKRVMFLVQGQEVETLDGHLDLTNYFVPDSSLIAQNQ